MKKRLFTIAAIILLVMPVFLAAQESKEPPKPILKEGDVARFIKTFPLIKEDFEKLGAKYEARSGDVTVPQALKASQEFLEVLKKHGWDEFFFQKFSTIMLGYSTIVYGKEAQKAQSEMEKSLKEIDSNPNIPESMKKQLKEQLLAAKGAMSMYQETTKKNIHPEDLLLIKPHLKELKAVIEEESRGN